MGSLFYKHLRDRRYNVGLQGYSWQRLVEYSSSNELVISQLTLEKELKGHDGCINTLDWSSSGELLLSGSDDTKLNIYDVNKDFELVSSIQTGHYLNILSAYFMPSTSDHIVISGSFDAQIRIFDTTREAPIDYLYFCHKQSVQKLGVFENNPNEFLSCSIDGTVRHFDLRVRHECSRIDTGYYENLSDIPDFTSMLLTQQRLNNTRLPVRCPPPLVHYSRKEIDIYSLSINQRNQNYFAVGGGEDEYIYLHDRRMHSTGESVKRFTSTNDTFGRESKELTAVKFSDFNGYELLGSWSNSAIYLFNINEEPLEPISTLPTYESLSSIRRPAYFSPYPIADLVGKECVLQRDKSIKDWEALIKIFKEKSCEEILQASKRLLHQAIQDYIQITYYDLTPWKKTTLFIESRLLQEATLIISALTRIRKCLQDHGKIHNNETALKLNPPLQFEFESYEFLMAKEELKLAKLLSPCTWKGLYNQAVGNYFASWLLLSFNDDGNRSGFYGCFTIPSTEACSHHPERDLPINRNLAEKLHNQLSTLSGFYDSPREPESTLYFSWDLLDDIQVVGDRPIDLEFESSEDDDLRYEFEDSVLYEKNLVPFKKRYSGHLNSETVKEVNFFGPADNYIISGSDDGFVYIWDKKQGNIVQILEADSEIVNVTKGHPSLPILAVSGIDSTVKIMTPKAGPFSTSEYHHPNLASSYSSSSRMSELEQIVSRNEIGMRSQNETDCFSQMKKTCHIMIALGLRLEESKLHDYRDLLSIAEQR
ncbi:WD40-repeat-containing domain protein [Sporodiniella umbellata]|nr:WD40-repeat-containing domain protein [Sporodiniella umbellata]